MTVRQLRQKLSWGLAWILLPYAISAQTSASSTQSATPASQPSLRNAGPGSQERAFALDRGANRVIALDARTAALLGSVSVDGKFLADMFQIPHAKRLAVFDRGPGKGTLAYGFHPEGKATVSFIDMNSMKIVSRLELGWGIGQTLASSDGKRLAVVCPGYASQKPEEALPAEVILIDTETSQIAGRFPVTAPASLMLTQDERTLIAFTSAWHFRDRSRSPEVQFADFATGQVLGKLSPSKPVESALLSTDGQYLYLLDPGEPSEKAEKNVHGSLVVVSVPTRNELSALDAGSSPRELIHLPASDQILILSDTAPATKKDETAGALHVFKGAQTVALTPVTHFPQALAVSPDNTVLYVVGSHGVSLVDAASFRCTDEIQVKAAGDLRDFAITPDGKRGIASFSGSDAVAVLDLDQKKFMANLVTGRKSVKGMRATTVALNAFSQSMENGIAWQQAQELANLTGETQYYTVHPVTIPLPPPANVSLAFSLDSKFAYALNDSTLDVTIIDTQAAKVLSMTAVSEGPFAGGLLGIETMPGGNAVAVLNTLGITFIDTKSNQKMKFGGKDYLRAGGYLDFLSALDLSPSGERACAVVHNRVVCIDTATMEEVGRLENLKDVALMVFEQP